MIGIVVVTHGQLARELVAAAEMIVGDIPNVTAVSIGWQESPEDAEREIEAAIARVDSGRGTVILTDMFGGTPTNLSLAFLEKGRVEVVTGVNLPMLIRVASLREDEVGDLQAVAAQAMREGKENVYVASDLLAGKAKGAKEKPVG
jgi:PTS system mannose-specific IIA component